MEKFKTADENLKASADDTNKDVDHKNCTLYKNIENLKVNIEWEKCNIIETEYIASKRTIFKEKTSSFCELKNVYENCADYFCIVANGKKSFFHLKEIKLLQKELDEKYQSWKLNVRSCLEKKLEDALTTITKEEEAVKVCILVKADISKINKQKGEAENIISDAESSLSVDEQESEEKKNVQGAVDKAKQAINGAIPLDAVSEVDECKRDKDLDKSFSHFNEEVKNCSKNLESDAKNPIDDLRNKIKEVTKEVTKFESREKEAKDAAALTTLKADTESYEENLKILNEATSLSEEVENFKDTAKTCLKQKANDSIESVNKIKEEGLNCVRKVIVFTQLNNNFTEASTEKKKLEKMLDIDEEVEQGKGKLTTQETEANEAVDEAIEKLPLDQQDNANKCKTENSFKDVVSEYETNAKDKCRVDVGTVINPLSTKVTELQNKITEDKTAYDACENDVCKNKIIQDLEIYLQGLHLEDIIKKAQKDTELARDGAISCIQTEEIKSKEKIENTLENALECIATAEGKAVLTQLEKLLDVTKEIGAGEEELETEKSDADGAIAATIKVLKPGQDGEIEKCKINNDFTDVVANYEEDSKNDCGNIFGEDGGKEVQEVTKKLKELTEKLTAWNDTFDKC